MSYRRRIIMEAITKEQDSNKLIDYFGDYKIKAGYGPESLELHWKGLRFRAEKTSLKTKTRSYPVANVANRSSGFYQIESLEAMGYDPTKNYNLKIKVVYKSISYQNELDTDDFFKFCFAGHPNYNGSNTSEFYSQELSVKEIQKGDEFIIPVNAGKFLNSLYFWHTSQLKNNTGSFLFTLIFEFYFEEITE